MTQTAEERLRNSPKFLHWRPERILLKQVDVFLVNDLAQERHYSAAELAELWGVSPQTIRNVFKDEPGVLRIIQKNGSKRPYTTMRVPNSVLVRVHKRLSATR